MIWGSTDLFLRPHVRIFMSGACVCVCESRIIQKACFDKYFDSEVCTRDVLYVILYHFICLYTQLSAVAVPAPIYDVVARG